MHENEVGVPDFQGSTIRKPFLRMASKSRSFNPTRVDDCTQHGRVSWTLISSCSEAEQDKLGCITPTMTKRGWEADGRHWQQC